MDADSRRILELERGFRRDGLPNLIVDLSAAEDIFTRAIPFLALVFVVEIVNALDVDAGWANLLLAVGGAVVLIGGFGVLNVVRGRRFLSIPTRFGIPELVAFVTLPALLPVVFSRQFLFGVNTVLVNAAILLLAYLVVGFGLLAIVRWAGVRFFAQLAASGTVLVRAVPLLLFFSLVIFFTTEAWQVFTATGDGRYWLAIGMFVLLGTVFLSVRLPGVVREIQADSDVGDVPLRRRERVNLAAVALISESLQVLFVSAAVWLFYVLLGTLLVSADVRSVWLGRARHGLVGDRGVGRADAGDDRTAARGHRRRGLCRPVLRGHDLGRCGVPRSVRRCAEQRAARDVRAPVGVPRAAATARHREPAGPGDGHVARYAIRVTRRTLLFSGTGSKVVARTEATLPKVEPLERSGASTMTVSVAEAPDATLPSPHETTPSSPSSGVAQVPPATLTNPLPTGRVCTTRTPEAAFGPRLMIFTVYVSAPPAATGEGDAFKVRRRSAAGEPVPASAIPCGAPSVSSSIVTDAWAAPIAVGAKATATAHLPPGDTVTPMHVSSVTSNDPGSSPVRT